MSKYSHIFFDLDHTLWDFNTNSRETLLELYAEYELKNRGLHSFEFFHRIYLTVNAQYWAKYHQGIISKEQLRTGRFAESLRISGLRDTELATKMGAAYLQRSPYKTKLFADTKQVLEYLSEKYALYIITNGFAGVQHIKITESGLRPYFKDIFISEQIGYQKPHKQIFLYALHVAGTIAEKALMVGDNIKTDILGAAEVGIDQTFFNPNGIRASHKATYEIHTLAELKEFL